MFSWFLGGLWFPSLECIKSNLQLSCEESSGDCREKWQIFIMCSKFPVFSSLSLSHSLWISLSLKGTLGDIVVPIPSSYVTKFLEENTKSDYNLYSCQTVSIKYCSHPVRSMGIWKSPFLISMKSSHFLYCVVHRCLKRVLIWVLTIPLVT